MNRPRLRQAAEEFAWTFAALFGASFLAFVSGWTKLPNLEALKAALYAALGSAIAGAAKAALWYFTGTSRPRDERGESAVVTVGIAILAIAAALWIVKNI